jgi:hypothetical protein
MSRKAGEHHEHAATHNREAARHLEAGDHEAAAHHAHSAQSHLHYATRHAAEAAKLHVEHQGQNTKEEVNEKMATYLSIVFGALLKSSTVAAATLNAGMALIKYRTVGRCYRLNLELRDPARAAGHLAVWLGVKVFAACLQMARAVFHMLLEASAEVGEWSMRRSPAVQERIRSLFVVR